MPVKPIAVLYENAEWIRPLLAALQRRGTPHAPCFVTDFPDPETRAQEFSLFVNRVGAAPAERPGEVVAQMHDYLGRLETAGATIVNGRRAFAVGASKVAQWRLCERLGLDHPATREVRPGEELSGAADGLRFPILFKPDAGGSGRGMRLFHRASELSEAGADPDFGFDGGGLLQEYIAPDGGAIFRIELLDGELVYGLRVSVIEGHFNYCPADGCRVDGVSLAVEPYRPPHAAVASAQRLLAAAGADVGGVEYLVSARDGRAYVFDVNPLSNYVADAPTLLGFDPTDRLAEYLHHRSASTG